MTKPSSQKRPKVLILGSGIGGLSTALQVSKIYDNEVDITLLCKMDVMEGSTRYAQGGIASVWSKEDSFQEHIQDTFIAGAGLCRDETVRLCVNDGPLRVQELIDWGVEFTKLESKTPSQSNSNSIDPTEAFDLHREGGHGQRRILHASDLTGLAIEKALVEKIKSLKNIQILEDYCAIDLITDVKLFRKQSLKPHKIHSNHGLLNKCLGVYALNQKSGKVETFPADVTVLSTGGAGKAYLYTTNPDTTTGDGIAMAYRAGAKIANLEFIQFHPTCLYHEGSKTFLITEALRGEGAQLRNLAGEAFMKKYDERGSLAPRDIVARSIDMEMKRTGAKHVWLDCTHLGEDHFKQHFPNIFSHCMKVGINPGIHFIPVVPATHYTCGGVWVDLNGKTTLENLYAVGEVACTGLHGANRLASNSLLEAVVFAERVAKSAYHSLKTHLLETNSVPDRLPEWESGRAVELEEQIDIATTWLEIRTILWNYVGIVRSDARLDRALKRLQIIKNEVKESYWKYFLTKDLIELRNLVTVAELIVRCAQQRKESRGLHFTVDYPERDDSHYLRDTIL